jgi:REP element-mobilizing transposase RayT
LTIQLALSFRTWGGKRKGAGRKPSGRMTHAPRQRHKAYRPVHVTLKVRPGLASLRGHRLGAAIGRLFRKHVGRREDFRVTRFSVQSNHLHLLVEAESTQALSRGLQGLVSSLGHTINRRRGRRGRVFPDRYHAHELTSPTEVRRALVYVLTNVSHCTSWTRLFLWRAGDGQSCGFRNLTSYSWRRWMPRW